MCYEKTNNNPPETKTFVIDVGKSSPRKAGRILKKLVKNETVSETIEKNSEKGSRKRKR